MKSLTLSLGTGLAIGLLSTSLSAAELQGASQASKRLASPKSRNAAVAYGPDLPKKQTQFNRFIVKYRPGSTAARSSGAAQRQVSAVAKLAIPASPGVGAPQAPIVVRHLRRNASGGDVLSTSRLLSQVEANNLLVRLRQDPDVLYAQPDYFKYAQGSNPNDPRFQDLQWDLTDPVSGIEALSAWNTTAGAGVVVAVLDTGYTEHRDLVANLIPGYDFVSWYGQSVDGSIYPDIAGDGDGRDNDPRDPGDWLDGTEWFCGGQIKSSSWHGTHVAGTVAAVTHNGIGIAGVAHDAKVQPVRVLGHCGGYTSDISDGIIWASGGQVPGVPDNPQPAEVLNLSLGGMYRCSDDPATQEAIDGARQRGVTVVVAAGNANFDAAEFSPASCNGVIAVGATGVDGAKAHYSNHGGAVVLSAPGGNARYSDDPDSAWIWSLGNSGTAQPVPGPAGDVLIGQIGTSMAAPHVAAVVAMMQSASVGAGHGALPPDLVRAALRSTVKPFAVSPSPNTPIGSGILSAAAAVALASRGIREEDLALPLVNRVPLAGQSFATGESQLYKVVVPVGTRAFSVRTSGGSGDVSLLIGRGTPPTATQYLMSSSRPGNTEVVSFTNPMPGTYFIRVSGQASSSGVSLLAAY